MLRVIGCELKGVGCELKGVWCELKAVWCELKAVWCELKGAGCELKGVTLFSSPPPCRGCIRAVDTGSTRQWSFSRQTN